MHDVAVVPGLEASRAFGVRSFICSAQIRQRLPRKHDAPPKRSVGPVALIDSNFVRRVAVLHEDGKVHAGRPAADYVDFHSGLNLDCTSREWPPNRLAE